jgi:hypothetical protein
MAQVKVAVAESEAEAENCCVPPPTSEALAGDTVTTPCGVRVMVAVLEVLVPSRAVMLAVADTVQEAAILPGAVYKPVALMLPTAAQVVEVGAFQVTALVASTFACAEVNCCVPPLRNVTAAGEMVMLLGGDSGIAAELAFLEPSGATALPFTVTDALEAMVAGAVYVTVHGVVQEVGLTEPIPEEARVTISGSGVPVVEGEGVVGVVLATLKLTVWPAYNRAGIPGATAVRVKAVAGSSVMVAVAVLVPSGATRVVVNVTLQPAEGILAAAGAT